MTKKDIDIQETQLDAAALNTKLSRRTILGSATGLAALGLTACGNNGDQISAQQAAKLSNAPKAPFDSVRDYIAALDANGLLIEIDEIDQDAYHMTSLFLSLIHISEPTRPY